MNTKKYLSAALISALQVPGIASSHKAEKSPNIVLIFADDLGYGDLGCYGGRWTPTPNIDRIAEEGVRFTDGYVNAPVSAPSRLGLLTGRYIQRLGCYWNNDSRAAVIPEDQLLLPQMLKKAGYTTGHIGKWNMNRPVDSVFDEVYHEIDWESDYFPGEDGLIRGAETDHFASNKVNGWCEDNDAPYLTDKLGDDAVRFIGCHAKDSAPFFLYMAFNAVHSPWQAHIKEKERYAGLEHEALQLYAAMLSSLDKNVGRVLEQLEGSGIDKNTLVVFLSDNGPAMGGPFIKGWPENWSNILVGSAAPLSGYKAQYEEGGIRVPFMIRFPGKLKAGKLYTRPVSSLDLFATFHAISNENGNKPETDGVNIFPYIRGKQKGDPHKALFWGGFDHPVCARMGDWKHVIAKNGNSVKLFNLKTDIGEKNDLAASHPEIVEQMRGMIEKWKEEMGLSDSLVTDKP